MGATGQDLEEADLRTVTVKRVWLGVVAVGLILPLLGPGHGHVDWMPLGMLVTYVGLAGVAYTAGRSPLWALWAFLVFLGPLLAVLSIRTTAKKQVLVPSSSKHVASWIIVGLLALPIPFLADEMFGGFKPFPAQSRQAEAKTNLGGIFVAQIAFYEEFKRYGTFEEIGFAVAGTANRYTYRIDLSGKPGSMIKAGIGEVTPDNAKVPAGFSATGFTATATANLDEDPTIDQWHVNDVKCCLTQADVNDVENPPLIRTVILDPWKQLLPF